jgi:hypothetical protein
MASAVGHGWKRQQKEGIGMTSLINEVIEAIYKQKPESLNCAEYADCFSAASDTIEFILSRAEEVVAPAYATGNGVEAIRTMRKNAHLPI